MPVGDEDQVSKEPEGGWEISVSSPNHLEVMIINMIMVLTPRRSSEEKQHQEMDVADATEGRRLTPRPPADEEARREANTIK